MAKTLRGALVGFGQVAEKAHAAAFSRTPELQIAAVADASPERLKAAQQLLPGAKAYPDFDALLAAEKDLDFAVIATPPAAHGAQVLAALKAGLHVLCEKPVTLAVDQYEAIKREAAAAGRAVCTVHNWAYSPQWTKIFSLIEGGTIGDVRHVELHALRTKPAGSALPGDWRTDAAVAGGGILMDHGWHNFYLLYRVLKGMPTRLTARLGGAQKGGVEDEALVFLEYADATAFLHLSWRSALRSNVAFFFGSKGNLELHDGHLLLQTEKGEERIDFPEKLSAGSAHPDWTAALLKDFAAAVGDPAHRLRNIEEAGFCLKMINRVYLSVRVGRNPLRASLGKPKEHPRSI